MTADTFAGDHALDLLGPGSLVRKEAASGIEDGPPTYSLHMLSRASWCNNEWHCENPPGAQCDLDVSRSLRVTRRRERVGGGLVLASALRCGSRGKRNGPYFVGCPKMRGR